MKKLALAFALSISWPSFSQVRLSFATDVSGLRNFSPGQQFWGLGQTVQANIHFTKKETVYAWLIYHSPGRFSNSYTASARSAGTMPASFDYDVKSIWRMREFSMGWKHYFKGGFKGETGWQLYSLAGLGLMFTKLENSPTKSIDANLYATPPIPVIGSSQFRRLTVDLGMGAEIPLGGDFFLYGDLRTYLPISFYPSPYLHRTKNVPLPLMACVGMRILFGYTY